MAWEHDVDLVGAAEVFGQDANESACFEVVDYVEEIFPRDSHSCNSPLAG